MPPRADRGAVVAIHFNGVPHPAVVLSVHDDVVLVIASGTSQHYADLEAVRIDSITRAGKSMRLQKPTYFYGRGMQAVARRNLSKWGDGLGRCPDYEVAKLQALMNKTLLEAESIAALETKKKPPSGRPRVKTDQADVAASKPDPSA